MIREVLDNPAELDGAMSRQYARVAQAYRTLLGKKRKRIAEIGCGRGQLTIPLAKIEPNLRFILVDRFTGLGYSGSYNVLISKLKEAKLAKRASIVQSDYRRWLERQQSESYDAVISSEFLSEIDVAETHRFIRECYRILKTGGMTIHSDLSPIPRNPRQKLLIKADSNPRWTCTTPNIWFSPNPNLVTAELRRSGFHRIRKGVIRSHLILKGAVGKKLLANTKSAFFEKHKKQLDQSGLELPDWVVISAVKP
jgi:ubiquinone/menaquinone biosynthesis C-methylase UbiE